MINPYIPRFSCNIPMSSLLFYFCFSSSLDFSASLFPHCWWYFVSRNMWFCNHHQGSACDLRSISFIFKFSMRRAILVTLNKSCIRFSDFCASKITIVNFVMCLTYFFMHDGKCWFDAHISLLAVPVLRYVRSAFQHRFAAAVSATFCCPKASLWHFSLFSLKIAYLAIICS